MSKGNFSKTPQKVQTIKTKYRQINTEIPVPQSIEILEGLEKYESRSMHGQMPVVWDRAEGFQVYDAWGNKWLDFTSTIFVANSGHGNEYICKALKKIAEKPLLHTYTYASRERFDYLKMLIENTPKYLEKAFLVSAGTEATECALKLMRLSGMKKGKKRNIVIAFEGCWHGRTMGAQFLGYNEQQKEWIGYIEPNILHMEFPYPWKQDAVSDPEKFFNQSIHRLLESQKINPQTDICGFMIETAQGWGAFTYPNGFIEALCSFAKANDICVTFDEIQTGFGRTGKLFGYMHYNVEPDMICCGKGLGSGAPLALVLGKTEFLDLPEVGSMSSTHSANPLVCAMGKANFEYILEKDLISNSHKMGEILKARLNQMKELLPNVISHVQSIGLYAALIFTDKAGKPLVYLCDCVCERAMQKGLLLVHTGRESIKIAPPLVITEEALNEGLDVLLDTIRECLKEVAI